MEFNVLDLSVGEEVSTPLGLGRVCKVNVKPDNSVSIDVGIYCDSKGFSSPSRKPNKFDISQVKVRCGGVRSTLVRVFMINNGHYSETVVLSWPTWEKKHLSNIPLSNSVNFIQDSVFKNTKASGSDIPPPPPPPLPPHSDPVWPVPGPVAPAPIVNSVVEPPWVNSKTNPSPKPKLEAPPWVTKGVRLLNQNTGTVFLVVGVYNQLVQLINTTTISGSITQDFNLGDVIDHMVPVLPENLPIGVMVIGIITGERFRIIGRDGEVFKAVNDYGDVIGINRNKNTTYRLALFTELRDLETCYLMCGVPRDVGLTRRRLIKNGATALINTISGERFVYGSTVHSPGDQPDSPSNQTDSRPLTATLINRIRV